MSDRTVPPELAPFADDGDAWLEQLRRAEKTPPLGRLGRFELLEIVGRGGQGVVYRAWDPQAGRQIALKRMLSGERATPATRQRFEREIETAAALRHAGVVTVYSVETQDAQTLLAMEWIEGVPMDEWASGRSPREIVRVFLAVADALHHAHQRGVLHRDLKPSNILVDPEGQPHLLDFGLATFLAGTPGESILTHTGQFLGTPAWSSPEQVRTGRDALDVRADLYSLGVILFAALTGEMPYDVETSLARAFQAIQYDDPRRPRSVHPEIPRDLEAIVLRLLEKAPEDRYQSVDALREDLGRFLRGDAVQARAHDWRYVLAKAVRRHRLAVAAAAVVGLVLVGFAGTMAVMFGRAEAEAERARSVQEFLQTTLLPEGPGSEVLETRLVDVLERAASRIDSELQGQPEVEARVWETLAYAYGQLWMWAETEEPARRALDLLVSEDHSDPRAANLLHLLGTSLTFQGKPDAVDVERRALERQTAIHGEESAEAAAAHAGLAFALWRSADPPDPAESERHYLQALAVFGRNEQPARMVHAGARYGYAVLLQRQQRPEEAIAMYRTALALYEQLPSADMHMIRCLEDFGHLLLSRGDPAAAEPLLRAALDRLPEEHGLVTAPYTMWLLAGIRDEAGDPDEAREWRRRSLVTQIERAAAARPGEDRALRALAREVRRDGLGADTVERVRVAVGAETGRWAPSLDDYERNAAGM